MTQTISGTTDLSLYISNDPQDYTPERLDLMKRTIAKGASNDELALFVEQCKRTGLDPFIRQIYSIRRRQWDAAARAYVEAQVIQVSIDGFRLVADRTRKYAGQVGPWWCGPDGQWEEVWLADEPPSAAKVGVLRHDFHQPMYGIALYKSYVQTNNSGDPVSRWKTDPAGMLAKCAESLALRRAFPNDLSGLYTSEEMEQADNPLTLKAPAQAQLPEGYDGKLYNLPTPPAIQDGEFTDESETETDRKLAEEQPARLAAMTLEEAKALPDSSGKPYGEIEPEQLAYRYNNMVKMLGKVDAEKEQEYRLKMRAIELIQKAAQASSRAKETKVLKELGYPEDQPALMPTDSDPYADLKAKTDANRAKGTKGDYFAFWQLIERAGWNRAEAKAIVDRNKGDANAAFEDLLAQVSRQ